MIERMASRLNKSAVLPPDFSVVEVRHIAQLAQCRSAVKCSDPKIPCCLESDKRVAKGADAATLGSSL